MLFKILLLLFFFPAFLVNRMTDLVTNINLKVTYVVININININ